MKRPVLLFLLSIFFCLPIREVFSQDFESNQEFQKFLTTTKKSPLVKAILNEQFMYVKDLVEKDKVELNPSNPKEGFPLLYAVMTNNEFMVAYLVSKGAKLETELAPGITPLAFAVYWDLYHSAKKLLELKANPHVKIGKATLLDLAEQKAFLDISILLERAGVKSRFAKHLVAKKAQSPLPKLKAPASNPTGLQAAGKMAPPVTPPQTKK